MSSPRDYRALSVTCNTWYEWSLYGLILAEHVMKRQSLHVQVEDVSATTDRLEQTLKEIKLQS